MSVTVKSSRKYCNGFFFCIAVNNFVKKYGQTNGRSDCRKSDRELARHLKKETLKCDSSLALSPGTHDGAPNTRYDSINCKRRYTTHVGRKMDQYREIAEEKFPVCTGWFAWKPDYRKYRIGRKELPVFD